MPTYSYRCTECGEAFDIQQAFTDDTLTVCPNCGGPLRKLFTAVGVSFTGSGFYSNDSRSKPAPEGGSSSSSESASAPAPSAPTAPATTPAGGTKESKSTASSAKE